MSHEEADPNFDTHDKPYSVPSGAGEPQGQNAAMAAALGLSLSQEQPAPLPPADTKEALTKPEAQEEGAKTAENYSKLIQDHAEELYGTLLLKAKADEDYLASLIDSKDPTERKYARKILERNADQFGAATPEDFKALRAKLAAGDDPTAQKLAEIEARQLSQDQKLRESEWETWKDKNRVTGDLAKVADELHSEYPAMPRGDLIAFARGKLGIAPTVSAKESSSAAPGGANPPLSEDPTSSPLAKKLLRQQTSDTRKFADDYLSGRLL